jgi:hypothetical protein
MRVARLAAALAAAATVAGCVTAGTDMVRFETKSPQQFVAMRDGESIITSRGRFSTVTVRPATRQIGNRPVFIVGIENTSKRPVDFAVANVHVTQDTGGGVNELKVYNYNELVQEENNAQVARALLVGALGGVNSGLAGRSYYRQDVAAEQNAALATQVAAAGQQNLAALEQLAIKDDTVMPGEMYGGKLYIDGPVSSDASKTKFYTINVMVGPDRHEIHVAQGVEL